MGAPLVKTRTVLAREPNVPPGDRALTVFVARSDDDGEVYRVTSIDTETWRDLGEPEQITVTIEPGDRLNPE